jgi:hypothetical protein
MASQMTFLLSVLCILYLHGSGKNLAFFSSKCYNKLPKFEFEIIAFFLKKNMHSISVLFLRFIDAKETLFYFEYIR